MRDIEKRLTRLEAATKPKAVSPLLVLPPGVECHGDAADLLAAERRALLGPGRPVVVLPANGRESAG